MIVRIVRMTFQEEKTEEFLEIFRESKDKIRAFEGCNHVELLQDVNQPHVYSTYSLWDSEAHLNSYRHSALFGKVWKATKALFADKPQAWSMQQVEV
ncbi:quinol monooxygenase YgiN [Pontibacter ummariensis]|uniref:Quinol monooxygenase YgiN n=1 Tax=Pontibacter ummariensis TaxID=1610492 RepID=A0A239J4I9_9BACT|nr:antibiotic biosynthesis monooxygenase family protein [Pontibacter ummariensis]PRY08878.1 quinol monooxygenase YgiN [Pontibacter ummariensis]SNT00767.1 Quinol monooxygenase YgiN [Pontibacter ummariensis]